MAQKPVVAQLPDGRELGFESESIAKRLHPDATIVRYQDGSAIEEPAKPAAKKSTEKKD